MDGMGVGWVPERGMEEGNELCLGKLGVGKILDIGYYSQEDIDQKEMVVEGKEIVMAVEHRFLWVVEWEV